MATNAQYLAANLANHYNFKQQQFNQILQYLVSQESITPGASTALIEDIQRQQSALKERRLALSRLRQSGLLADKELIVELEKIKSDLKEVTARGITDVNVAKANLEKAFQSELADEEAQGQSQFNRATNAQKAQEAATMAVVSPGATEQEIVDSVVNYYNEHLKSAHDQLGGDSVAYAQFNQGLKQHLQDVADQRGRIAGRTVANAGDKVLAQLNIDTAETPEQARDRVNEQFQKEVINPLRPGTATLSTTARAVALGMSEESLDQIFGGQAYVDSPDARKFARAAYFSRYLPQNLDENLQPRLGGEGLTEAEFLAKLQAGDEEASRLYNMVLQREPSEIALLSEGQYPYELYQITRAERGLDKRRGQLGAALDPARKRSGYEALYQEARSIYNNLFRGGGVRDPGARQANMQRLERGGPELKQAVSEIGRTEDTQNIEALEPADRQAIADASGGRVAVRDDQLVDANTGEEVRTLAGLVRATGAGEEAVAQVASLAEQMRTAQSLAVARTAARQTSPMAQTAMPTAVSSLAGAQIPTSLAKPRGLSTDVAAPLTSRQPLGAQPPPPLVGLSRPGVPAAAYLRESPPTEAGLPVAPDVQILGQLYPNDPRTQRTAFATGLVQADAITGAITGGVYGSNDRITNNDMLAARIQAWEKTDPFDLPDGVKSALADLGKRSKGGFTEKNIEDILGSLSNNPTAKQSATSYAKIHAGN